MYASSVNAAGYIARRERLGVFQAKPVVTAEIPRRPREYIMVQSEPIQIEPDHEPGEPREPVREIEAKIVQQHRIAAERWKDILREVAEKHDITVMALKSRRRAVPVVHARQEACYRLLTELGMSYPQVARRIGYTDHTTAIHAVKKYAERTGLSVNRRIETEEVRKMRNAEIVRGFLLGETKQELSEKHDLSIGRISDILLKAGCNHR